MANIKKSFNFRSGVQVDDDNLVVSPTGLIGIGTTVPTQALDIRGDFVCTGLTSSITGNIGFLTVTTLEPTELIGAGVSIKAGIITGQAGDIVTYFGDGGNLLNLPTSQWEDTNAGFAVSSIYNTGGTVGIATTNPQFTLQVGNNPNASQIGVGIASAGHIKVSGVITATSYRGDFAGTVSGTTIGKINVTSGISTFNNAQVSGIITASSGQNKIPALYATINDLPSATEYHGMFAHVHATGKGYYSHAGAWFELVNKNTAGNVELSGDIDVDGHTELDNVNIAGVSTLGVTTMSAGSNFHFGNHATFKDEKFLFMGDDAALVIGHHAGPGHSQIKHDSAAQDLVLAADRIRIINRAENKGLASFTEGGQVVLKYDGNDKLKTSGIGVTIYNHLDTTNIDATGIITSTTQVAEFRIGIGTNSPVKPLHIRKPSGSAIQLTSDSGTASIKLGHEVLNTNLDNSEIRYGFVSNSAPYEKDGKSLSIINYNNGNFNYYLSGNDASAAVGDFFWHKGLNNVRLMTLTNGGRLGIGITLPTKELDVSGNATVSGSLDVQSLNVTNTISANLSGNVTGNVNGDLTGNVNATSGTSQFNHLDIAGVSTFGNAKFSAIGFGQDAVSGKAINVHVNSTNTVFVDTIGKVGIRTTSTLSGVTINASQANASIGAVAIGATVLKSAVDFADAGTVTTRFMIPPKVNNGERANLTGVIKGAMIYNTDTDKLQVYTGSGGSGGWETISSS